MLRRSLRSVVLGFAFWLPCTVAASPQLPSPDLTPEIEYGPEPEPSPLLQPLPPPAAPGVPGLALLAPALSPPPARPRGPARSAWVGVSGGRTLRGHTFVPSQYVRDPFTATYFTTITAASMAYGAPTTGAMLSDSLLFAGYTQAFSVQVSVLRVLALRAAVRGGVRSGLTESALRQGGTDVHYGGSAGVTASFRIKDVVRLGVSGDVDAWSNYNLNVVNAIDTLLKPLPTSIAVLTDRLASVQDGLLRQGQPLVVALGLSMAAGLHRGAGVLAEVSYLEQIRGAEPGATPRALSASVALSLDLHAVSPVPVGALLGYRLVTALLPGPELPAQQVALGLFYTGRPQLVLGLDCLLTMPLSGGPASALAFDGAIIMRHYW